MKNLLYIGNKLSKHGFSVTTIETLGPLLEREGFELTYASSKSNKIVRLLDMLLATIRLKKKVDFLLIDTYSSSNFWFAFLVSQLARMLNLKYIPILHGGNLPARLMKNPKASRFIFENSYKNIAPSKYILQVFTEAGFKNTHYIPNSIEIENYSFKKRTVAVPKLLWVRAFAKIYNPNMAIEVFKSIKNQFPEATLTMVGSDKDGSLATAKKLAHDYNLDVFFPGQMQKKEWIEMSSDYSVFLNTSRFDNMPVSIIEAMALGMPVISTNVGGISYLLENKKDALLVENEAVAQMVEAIKELCDNPSLVEKLSVNARQKAQGFDWHFIKNKWKETLI